MKRKILIGIAVIAAVVLVVAANSWIKRSADNGGDDQNVSQQPEEDKTSTEKETSDDTPKTDGNAENTEKDNNENGTQEEKVPEPNGSEPDVLEGTSFFYQGSLYTFLPDNKLELTECYADIGAEQVTIPEYIPYENNSYYITRIGSNSFRQYCSEISKINFPTTITDIGYQAFEGTKWLENLLHTDYVMIGDSTLAYYQVKEGQAVIPDGVKHIGSVFFRNEELEKVVIPDTVETISEKAFYYCTSLNKVRIPETITQVGSEAFTGSPWLKEQEEFVIVGDRILLSYTGSDAVVTIPDKVQTIGAGAFANTGVKEVMLPDSVKTIEKEAFAYCSQLEKVTLPDGLQTISSMAFALCNSLESIVIPESVVYMGMNLFLNCEKLSDISISEPLSQRFQNSYLGIKE